ncbi:MAG: beta-galactosidase [Bacteroidota bacterium]
MKNLLMLLACWLITAELHAAPTSQVISLDKQENPTTIMLRIAWEFCQPEETTFDWQFIDVQIASARQQGKKIILQIDPQSGLPAWLNDPATHQQNPATKPSLNTRLLATWTAFVERMGEKYGQESAIEKVYISHIESSADWSKSSQLANQLYAWMRVVDAFEKAFPKHQLIIPQPMNAEQHIVQLLQTYANTRMGNRCLIAINPLQPTSEETAPEAPAPTDLMLWEQWNQPVQKGIEPNTPKKKTTEKMIANIVLLGNPSWTLILK